DKGIVHQFTTPYRPQQNMTAERANRTITTIARSLLISAKLPDWYAVFAFLHAIYLHNRITRTGKTPYEIMHGMKPDLSYLKTFGATVYAQIPNIRSKFQPRSIRSMLLGMTPKNYVVVIMQDTMKGKIIHNRDVVADERMPTSEPNDTKIENKITI